ncbi:MAG: dicarboxylate/amino acid:cation symporter [Clostridia bacterium]|jgi:Na+/H+-dicarboxylate symporter|nr:dicarboxylate/amino acid:cation symporter [Clostridia bacterium]
MKKLKLVHKIFLGLILGTIFGIILSNIGVESPFVAFLMPWLQLVGDLFLRLIKMIIVPLVFFSIISGVSHLTDLKKLRSIGIKSLVIFFLTTCAAVSIGLIIAQVMKPGAGLVLGEMANSVEMKVLPSVQEQILGIFPTNPIDSMAKGEMLPIISFSIFIGAALLMMGEKGQILVDVIDRASDAMYKITDIVVEFTPYGVFALMAKATALFGLKIFGPVFKFILADYTANLLLIGVVYTALLILIGKVSPMKFYKKTFQQWLLAFSTCSSSATLPVTMRVASEELGIPKETASFVLPLGATINMNGTSIFFGLVVMFVSQIYGLPVALSQQAMLVLTGTLMAVGCAAVPQSGLILGIALITSMGLPLEAVALVAGIYRIIDQIHTSTNSLGDNLTAVLVSSMEGDLDREMFNNGGMFAKEKSISA